MTQVGCTIDVRAAPGGSMDAVVGRVGAAFKVRVRAPAVDGKANEALCAFLAERLGLSRRAVRILRGETSRIKCLNIDGLTLQEVGQRLLGTADASPGA